MTIREKKQRNKEIEMLRNTGTFLANSKVLSANTGTLFVRRCSLKHHCAFDYLPCTNCYAYFIVGELWRHNLQCTGEKQSQSWTTAIFQGIWTWYAFSACLFLSAFFKRFEHHDNTGEKTTQQRNWNVAKYRNVSRKQQSIEREHGNFVCSEVFFEAPLCLWLFALH